MYSPEEIRTTLTDVQHRVGDGAQHAAYETAITELSTEWRDFFATLGLRACLCGPDGEQLTIDQAVDRFSSNGQLGWIGARSRVNA